MSWPILSVRGNGREQSRASSCRGLVASLTRHRANFCPGDISCPGREREATKHVDSFGVGFWIRVRFSAPPPKTLPISDCRFPIYGAKEKPLGDFSPDQKLPNRKLAIGN